jgi:hypothetical protein
MQVLGEFQDTQAALLILCVCMGVCRVNFLLRALPQPLVKDAANVFDDLMQETFASISCAVLPDRVWTAAQLPIPPPDCPGLGLTSAENIMSAAHLPSLDAARSVLSKLLPASLLQDFVSTPHVKSTFDDFRSRSDTSAPSFSQRCSEACHEQKPLVGQVHKKMAEGLKQLRRAAEVFRVQALSLTGAKEWLTAVPYEHDLRIPPHLMKWALATYLQAPLLQQPLDCSRCEQGEMDVWGLHVMRCHIGFKHRHEALNRALSQLFGAAGRLKSIEPVGMFTGVQDAHERPDHCLLVLACALFGREGKYVHVGKL